MSYNTQYRKNLKDLATACKDYTDNEILKLKYELGTYDLSVSSDTTTSTTKTVPSNATRCKIKRIYGNTQKLNPSTASDSTSYSIKTMPSTVYDFDVSKVEGKSEKSENLAVNPQIINNVSTDYNTIIALENLNLPAGTYTISFHNVNTLNSGTRYYLTADPSISYIYTGANSSITDYSLTFTTTTTMTKLYVRLQYISSGNTGTTTNVMLNTGSTALDYEEGYTGIHNFEWTGVKVEGSNICANANESYTLNQSGNLFLRGWVSPYVTRIFNASASTTATSIGISFELTEATLVRFQFGSDSGQNTYFEQQLNAGTYYIKATTNVANSQVVFSEFMLNKGSTALDYTPYITPTTLPIDLSSILYNGSPLFEGNSLKAVNTIKDSITPYKATKKLGSYTITGNETFNIEGSRLLTIDTEITDCKLYGNVLINDSLTNRFSYNDIFNNANSIGMTLRNSKCTFLVYDSSITDATSGKTKYTGKTIVYELATPIEVSIDWSATLRHITGYSNGTITLLNTNNQDTDNTITYNSIIKENCCAKIVQSRGGNVVKTINLPTTASDGYSAGSVANVRDLTTSKRVGNVSKESNLGSLDYSYFEAGTNSRFRFTLSDIAGQVDRTIPINVVCPIYTARSYDATWGDMDIFYENSNTGSKSIGIKSVSYTDTTTFKLANTNEPLYYELDDASKTETSIDSVDNIIEVEPSDVLSFYDENDNLVTIPSDIDYLIEEVKA